MCPAAQVQRDRHRTRGGLHGLSPRERVPAFQRCAKPTSRTGDPLATRPLPSWGRWGPTPGLGKGLGSPSRATRGYQCPVRSSRERFIARPANRTCTPQRTCGTPSPEHKFYQPLSLPTLPPHSQFLLAAPPAPLPQRVPPWSPPSLPPRRAAPSSRNPREAAHFPNLPHLPLSAFSPHVRARAP